jgi:hypothetical protein
VTSVAQPKKAAEIVKKISEEKKPKTSEDNKPGEEKIDLRGLFGGTTERRGRGGRASARAFPAKVTSRTAVLAKPSFSEDDMDVDMELPPHPPPPNNGGRQIVNYDDLDSNFFNF